MSRRIDIELTSALSDESWTWRAAGAKQPKGTLDGSILDPGASVGDIIKVEVEQEIEGITVLSVVGGRPKEERDDLLELLPAEQAFKPVIETRAKRDRNDRGRSDRGPRRDRDDRPGGRRGRDDRGGRDNRGGRESQGDRGRGGRGGGDDRGGRGRKGGPSFTPPPEVPQRPKPKRLKPGKKNKNAVLADLPEEQRAVAELALQGMGAVRQRLREENDKAVAEGRSPMPEATVIKLAEDMLPKLRVAEWRDRAEAAQRQMEHLDLRDLRSVVAAAGDPAVARDETTAALAAELTEALATKQEQELRLWFGDVDAALAVGRVIRALRLSSQPPKAGVPFPSDIAQRLVDSANASLAPMDSAERWIAMLEAAAFSPVRTSIAPVRKPDEVTDELLATVKRLAPALPQVAALFEVEVEPGKPMPKPLRPGPRNRKDGKGGKDGKAAKDGERTPRNRRGNQKPGGQGKAPADRRSDSKTGGSSSKGSGSAEAPVAGSTPASDKVVDVTEAIATDSSDSPADSSRDSTSADTANTDSSADEPNVTTQADATADERTDTTSTDTVTADSSAVERADATPTDALASVDADADVGTEPSDRAVDTPSTDAGGAIPDTTTDTIADAPTAGIDDGPVDDGPVDDTADGRADDPAPAGADHGESSVADPPAEVAANTAAVLDAGTPPGDHESASATVADLSAEAASEPTADDPAPASSDHEPTDG